MRRITVAERRARLALRHCLAPAARAATPEEATAALVAIHSSDPATVFLSAWARMHDPSLGAVERALYVDRTLIRFHGMRRTLWVIPVDLVGALFAASTHGLALQERRRVLGLLEDASIADDPARWVAEVGESTVRMLRALGEASTTEIGRLEPRLLERVTLAAGKRYETQTSMATRIVPLLSMEGRIVRGRPLGTWIASQYRWVPVDVVLHDGIPHVRAHQGRAEIVRRWLRSFGPGSLADLRWWTGWPAGVVRQALSDVGAVEVEVEMGVDAEGAAAFLLPDDLEPAPLVEPWAALLPGLDATTMGWWDRAWYLGPHGARLFDGHGIGNAGPTVWVDGRVVGGWGQRPGGEIVLGLLEDVGADATALVEAAAARMQAVLGTTRVTPRFRTPLERDLSA